MWIIKLFLIILLMLILSFITSEKIQNQVSLFFVPKIKYKNFSIEIPKKWKLFTYTKNIDNIYYFGFLNIPVEFLYLMVPFRDNFSFKDIQSLEFDLEKLSHLNDDDFSKNSVIYNFYDTNNEYDFIFVSDTNYIEGIKKIYNKINKIKSKVLYYNKDSFATVLDNFKHPTLLNIEKKSLKDKTYIASYLVSMDKYMIIINFDVKKVNNDFNNTLQTILKKINSK